jgi:hypothetical protein
MSMVLLSPLSPCRQRVGGCLLPIMLASRWRTFSSGSLIVPPVVCRGCFAFANHPAHLARTHLLSNSNSPQAALHAEPTFGHLGELRDRNVPSAAVAGLSDQFVLALGLLMLACLDDSVDQKGELVTDRVCVFRLALTDR